MLQRLDPSAYESIRPLVGGLDYHLAVSAVLAGASRGAVYAVTHDEPRAALIHTGHRWHLGGDPASPDFADGLKGLFDGVVYPHGLAAGDFGFMLYPDDHPGWGEVIDYALAGRPARQFARHYYHLTALDQARAAEVPAGMTVHAIDADLLAQTTLTGYAELVEELYSERASVEDFLAHSFGTCALAEAAIAGMCTSEYNTGTRVEVGINTMEAYQRKGVASALLWAFAQTAFARGVTGIGWHCWSGNAPSVGTALRNGFRFVREYPATVAYFNPAT